MGLNEELRRFTQAIIDDHRRYSERLSASLSELKLAPSAGLDLVPRLRRNLDRFEQDLARQSDELRVSISRIGEQLLKQSDDSNAMITDSLKGRTLWTLAHF